MNRSRRNIVIAITTAAVAVACGATVAYSVSATASQRRAVTASAYVPIPNCRIVDTSRRGGRIRSGSTGIFDGTGHDFHLQGGSSSCTSIPSDAVAISMRLTAFSALHNGAFVASPFDAEQGLGTLYYGKGVNVTTGTIQQLGHDGAFTVKDVAGPAQVAVDVNGYFIELPT
jgi:hypothetical protein